MFWSFVKKYSINQEPRLGKELNLKKISFNIQVMVFFLHISVAFSSFP